MNHPELQLLSEQQLRMERERMRKTAGILSRQLLKRQNLEFAGSTGISQNNRESGFAPAFMDSLSGRTEISRFADGRPAPLHLLDCLPEEWVASRDVNGHVFKLHSGIIAGFLRNGHFFTRDEAVRATAH